MSEFLDEVASANLVPGAGYVSAMAVAMAAGLLSMAARLSREHWSEAGGASAQAEALRLRVTPLAEENADAYLSAVSLLRGQEPAGGGSRDEALALALDRAAEVPLRIGEAASDASALAAVVAERGEPSLRADAATAALLSDAAARAAATLVEVNLGITADDERIARARELAASSASAAEQALSLVT